MKTYLEIKQNSYFDSVTLMLLSRKLLDLEGIEKANVSMGTDHNKGIIRAMGFTDTIDAGPNDLVVIFSAESERIADQASLVIKDQLYSTRRTEDNEEYRPRMLHTALKSLPDANLALLSIPGEHVYQETEHLLEAGLNVMIFSDNVSVEEELGLKKKAHNDGLLVMGPDCGTAIINGKPLAFANAVRKGKIGIVGASGTGIQEVSVCIHKLGHGVSHAIGTGGRDLSAEIGGITMIDGIKLLASDPATNIMVLISKPPEKEVADRVLQAARNSGKPFVVNFLGGTKESAEKYDGIFAETLEDAAIASCSAVDSNIRADAFSSQCNIEIITEAELKKFNPQQKYLRGLYTGGTLCKEAVLILSEKIDVHSNIPRDKQLKLEKSTQSVENTVVDLGEDEFTRGRPHPMIDPDSRAERIAAEYNDPTVRVILLDVMLGYGSHNNPADAVVKAVEQARKRTGRYISVVASVCGVEEDPQVYSQQKKILEDAGIIVMPTNAQAVKLAYSLI